MLNVVINALASLLSFFLRKGMRAFYMQNVSDGTIFDPKGTKNQFQSVENHKTITKNKQLVLFANDSPLFFFKSFVMLLGSVSIRARPNIFHAVLAIPIGHIKDKGTLT